jgi:hypothetical protein
MESEGRRNLLDKQAGLIGSGYKSAYDTGLGQFNKERESEEASRQFGANFGLKTVDQLANMGAVERALLARAWLRIRSSLKKSVTLLTRCPSISWDYCKGCQLGLILQQSIKTQSLSCNQM